LTLCDVRDCGEGAALYCFYVTARDGKSRTYRTYRFCAFHGKEIRGGEWEEMK